MLGRRSIRIKVMQMLYTTSVEESLTSTASKHLSSSIDSFIDFYHYSLTLLASVAEYIEIDAQKKAEKLIPTDEEVNVKLLSNPVIVFLMNNEQLQTIIDKKKFLQTIDKHSIRTLYLELIATPFYQEYIQESITTEAEEYQFVRKLAKFLFKQEVFLELLDDQFISFYDDFDLVKQFVYKQLKKASSNLEELLFTKDNNYTVLEDFAQDLLAKVIRYNEELSKQIEPFLQNWDQNRLAIIDKVILNMALCEFLYFPEIPVKVTMNEYIEIAKQYSTPKSKEFVNGVLDRLMKQLQTSGKIIKSGRGLQ